MRPSRTRSRSSKSRNTRPSGGNIVNRVFDSSGPEGKVRGTPQQVIDKYLQLHRDAQLSGDRVNAENFAQHAEHYTRMLAEATREIERAREEQEEANRQRQADRDRARQQREEREQEAAQADASEGDSGLVDLPEGKPAFLDARPKQERRPRRRAEPEADAAPQQDEPQAEAKPARAPRAPRARKPRASSTEGQTEGGDGAPAVVPDVAS